MTLLDNPNALTVAHLDTPAQNLKVTQAKVIASEWLKFRTVRSSWLVIIAAVGSMLGAGIAIAWSTAAEWGQDHGGRGGHEDHFNALTDPLSGLHLAQLAIGVLAILLVAGEYPGGMIRATFGAVPKRLPVLWAKLAVAATVTAVTMIPVTVATFFISQRLLTSTGQHIGWASPNVPRVVIGSALYLIVVSILAVGIGAIIRNIAGAVAAFVGIVLVLPGIALALSPTWANRINKWLPSNAGQAILNTRADPTFFSPWRGLGIFLAYAAATVIAAAVLLKRRDA